MIGCGEDTDEHQNVPDYDAEHSEAVLYHVRVLEELEETEEALRLLDISAKSRVITDRVAIMETRGTFVFLFLSSDVLLRAFLKSASYVNMEA